MARKSKFLSFYPWSGGLLTAVDPIIANPNNLVQADNIQFTSSASRRKRGGQVYFNSVSLSTASALIYGVDYWATVSNVKRPAAVVVRANPLATVAASVYRSVNWVSSGFANFNTIALVANHGGVTSTIFNNDLVMGFKSNGTTSLRVWDNQSTASNLVLMTAASGVLPARSWIVQEFNRRLFAAGDPTNPDLLSFSAIGDRTRWGGVGSGKGSTLVIGTENDGDPDGITAIIPGLGGESALYIAKRTRIYRVDTSSINPDNWSVRLLSNDIGVLNPNAWCSVDQQDVAFVSDRGVHLLSQLLSGTAFREGAFLSSDVHPDFTTNAVVDLNYKDRVTAEWYPTLNSILIGVKLNGESTAQAYYAYNVEINPATQKSYGWYRWRSTPSNFLFKRFNKITNTTEIYGLGERVGKAASDRGRVIRLDNDRRYDFTTSQAILVTLKTPNIYPAGDIVQEKAFLNVAFLYRGRDNSSFSAQYAIDGINITPSLSFRQVVLGNFILGSSVLGVGVLGAAPLGIKPNWQHIKGVGHEIQLTVTHDVADADLEILGMLIEYEDAGESQNAFRKIGN